MSPVDFDYSDFSFNAGGEAEICPMDLALVTPKQASVQRKIRVASLEELKSFTRVANETLVHKIDRDLWTIKAEGGGLVIERMFDETGEPIKG